ncbi:MAG TPA: hypothetical protein VKX17_27755 [Planctomycetota bacterium]|nr:hypothetical protein [Planctomycetota bacterium]
MRQTLVQIAVVLVLSASAPLYASLASYDQAPVNYSKSEPHDAIARLQAELAAGKIEIPYDAALGYLPGVLIALNISPKSQMLVFSKTSLQVHRISPETPRAVYFNDDVYIGYCQKGDVMEVASTDPQLGAIFYSLSQKNTGKPVFTRQTDKCLQCHDSSSMTLGVPGHIMRSVYPDIEGRPIYSAGTFHTTQDSPFNERWGGWYVSGTSGSIKHMGNTLIKNKDDAEHADFAKGCNVTDLSALVDTSSYLAPHSDIVALMVAEHQTTMHNLISRASFEMRLALLQERDMNKALGEPADRRSPSTLGRLKSVAEPLVKYMLYFDEPVFTDTIKGTSGFAEEFAARGLKDKRSRSLHDFDLKKRLFKYPCSFLIYSESFNALPPIVLDYVKNRLTEIFNGKEGGSDYARLTPDDRDNIREILAATWKGAPESWKY